MYYCSLLLEEHTWPWNEELEALQHVEPNDLSLFTPVLLRKTYLECYMSGLHLTIDPSVHVQNTSTHVETNGMIVLELSTVSDRMHQLIWVLQHWSDLEFIM
jgi:secreted Zn-dependent insulinase-like peptidase